MKIIEVVYTSGATANVPLDDYDIVEEADGTRMAKGTVTVNGITVEQEINITPKTIIRLIKRAATSEEIANIKGISLAGKNAPLSGPAGGV